MLLIWHMIKNPILTRTLNSGTISTKVLYYLRSKENVYNCKEWLFTQRDSGCYIVRFYVLNSNHGLRNTPTLLNISKTFTYTKDVNLPTTRPFLRESSYIGTCPKIQITFRLAKHILVKKIQSCLTNLFDLIHIDKVDFGEKLFSNWTKRLSLV